MPILHVYISSPDAQCDVKQKRSSYLRYDLPQPGHLIQRN